MTAPDLFPFFLLSPNGDGGIAPSPACIAHPGRTPGALYAPTGIDYAGLADDAKANAERKCRKAACACCVAQVGVFLAPLLDADGVCPDCTANACDQCAAEDARHDSGCAFLASATLCCTCAADKALSGAA